MGYTIFATSYANTSLTKPRRTCTCIFFFFNDTETTEIYTLSLHDALPIASPDELRGNVVKAFIVLAPDYEPSDELGEEIKTFVRERLSAYAYPRRIEFVPDLPKTLTGKIRRIVLRQRELERAHGTRT